MKIGDFWCGPYMQFNSDFICYGFMKDSKPFHKFRHINIKTGNYLQIKTPNDFITAKGHLIHKKGHIKYRGQSLWLAPQGGGSIHLLRLGAVISEGFEYGGFMGGEVSGATFSVPSQKFSITDWFCDPFYEQVGFVHIMHLLMKN